MGGFGVLGLWVLLAVVLLLSIVFWLDHPFGTEIGVTPQPFRHAQQPFDVIDRGV